MSTKDSEALEQQRQRRNRINRMKTGIIVTITVWMLVSLLAIILLTVQVARLSSHVKRLEKAGQINQYNETRKDLDKSMTEEANNIVANLEGLSERRSIVLYNEEWHKGVIGIVASRLTEVYYRPAVVLTRTDDMATGSARSVSGFDVVRTERVEFLQVIEEFRCDVSEVDLRIYIDDGAGLFRQNML